MPCRHLELNLIHTPLHTPGKHLNPSQLQILADRLNQGGFPVRRVARKLQAPQVADTHDTFALVQQVCKLAKMSLLQLKSSWRGDQVKHWTSSCTWWTAPTQNQNIIKNRTQPISQDVLDDLKLTFLGDRDDA